MLSRNIINRLKQFETPYYLYDMDLLRKTCETASSLAGEYGYKLHYAIKANFDEHILRTINSYGIGIDTASGNEVRRALECGFPAASVVYAGVGKKDKELQYAIEQGIFSINCESMQELGIIDSIAGSLGKVQRVALRINPDVDAKTLKCINTGMADCKFGISFEELLAGIETIKSYHNISIEGVHLHIGSQILDLSVYVNLCNKVNSIIDKLVAQGLNFNFIDLGGGLGIDYDSPETAPVPDFKQLFKLVHDNLNADGREVHFEFGRSLVAQCGELITSVLFNKTTATGIKLVFVDASMTELIRPALYGAHHRIENISAAAKSCGSEAEKEIYTIAGTACESTDIFAEGLELPVTRRGDLISIKSAGAYGMSMASRYNLHELPAAVYSDKL